MIAKTNNILAGLCAGYNGKATATPSVKIPTPLRSKNNPPCRKCDPPLTGKTTPGGRSISKLALLHRKAPSHWLGAFQLNPPFRVGEILLCNVKFSLRSSEIAAAMGGFYFTFPSPFYLHFLPGFTIILSLKQ